MIVIMLMFTYIFLHVQDISDSLQDSCSTVLSDLQARDGWS